MQYTINSDDEIEPEIEDVTSDEESEKPQKNKEAAQKKKKKKKVVAKTEKSKKSTFQFEFDNGDLDNGRLRSRGSQESEDEESEGGGSSSEVDVDDNVRQMPRAEERVAKAAKKAASKKAAKAEESDEEAGAAEDDEDGGRGMNAADEAAYFDSVVDSTKGSNGSAGVMFSQLNLSRSLLRAVEAIGYTQPTPIQAQVIPYAMAGRDICASAVTGSGKTAAFVLPFLERLLHRSRADANIHVLIITPTRELATQIHSVFVKLAEFTDVTSALILGGKKDVKSQEATLRQRPDVVICTPGRMLDHLRNSPSVSIDNLAVLVLDEVDRLLDLGFQAEVEELVKFCPESRQTMLFSATMTPKVEDLAKLSLKRPVRIKTASGTTTLAPRLVQEFVKVRDTEEVEAMMLALVCRSFGKKTIVFFDLKTAAHRFCALLGLMDVRASELHGNLQQAQRDLALQRFREGLVDVMVCTDIAARGLDIPGVLCVINAEMPRNASTYVHRVGRTARAGNQGRAITLVSDGRRKIMKEVLKGEGGALSMDGGQVLSRTIPAPVMAFYQAKIDGLEGQIAAFFKEERARLQLEQATRDAEQAENLLLHADEIAARPARTWYQTEREKTAIKEATKARVKEEQEEARVGRAAAVAARTAAEKAAALAKSDDYQLDDKQKSKGEHRLSRKKRRRAEALRAAEDATPEETAKEQRAFDLVPKKAKLSAREKEKEGKDRALTDYGAKGSKITIQHFRDVDGEDGDDGEGGGGKRQKLVSQHTKVLRPKIAVGGMDQDMLEWGGAGAGSSGGMSKKQLKEAAREKEFTDFDVNKRLRKGGKAGHKAFKSKSKFKRRK